MRYAIDLPNFGDYGDPRLLADLAREAEEHGWGGFFIWDHIIAPGAMPVADTTVTLAAIALETQRIRFGPLVLPLPRRSPWKMAREVDSLPSYANTEANSNLDRSNVAKAAPISPRSEVRWRGACITRYRG